MHIGEHQDWLDGFDSWEEVWPCLTDDWERVVDLRQRLEVERDLDQLVVVEVDRGLGARQRRELHRLGFRPVQAVRATLWRWEADRARPRHVPSPETADPVDGLRIPELLRMRMVTEELISQRVQRVVREVFRSSPGDLAVVFHREPDVWEDDWDQDEDEQWSTG